MTPDKQKQAAAKAALGYIKPGMKVGLGTGSTAAHFIALLGEKVKQGLDVECVPTSNATREQAVALGIKLTTLEQHPILDIAVDGCDEFDPKLNLIKGGGGALLLEKIVAASSRAIVIIADQSKQVATLGKFSLPVEVVPFGIKATAFKIDRSLAFLGLKGKIVLRGANGKTFRTEGGHAILDVNIGHIPDIARLSQVLTMIPGVVEHGLFVDLCTTLIMGGKDGVKTFNRASS
jgi:ribose 5-phosphate isomerase A